MPLSNRLGLAIIVLLAIVIGAVWFMRPAPQSVTPAPTATIAAQAAAISPMATSTPVNATDPSTDAMPESDADATPESAPAVRVFQLDPTRSEVRFVVDEILFGSANTVVGRTADVSGTIAVDLVDPGQTSVSPVRVNARDLATDNRFRNRSVNRLILQSNRDEYQYITFTPTLVEGLPDSASVGAAMNLQVKGDLQIRDIVQPVIFSVTVTATSESQLEGFAVGTVQRADYDLNIPNVEGVADVSENVRLELDFVANAEGH